MQTLRQQMQGVENPLMLGWFFCLSYFFALWLYCKSGADSQTSHSLLFTKSSMEMLWLPFILAKYCSCGHTVNNFIWYHIFHFCLRKWQKSLHKWYIVVQLHKDLSDFKTYSYIIPCHHPFSLCISILPFPNYCIIQPPDLIEQEHMVSVLRWQQS